MSIENQTAIAVAQMNDNLERLIEKYDRSFTRLAESGELIKQDLQTMINGGKVAHADNSLKLEGKSLSEVLSDNKTFGFYAWCENDNWRYPNNSDYGDQQWIKIDSKFLGADYKTRGDFANNFNTSTGIFTAPKSGFYFFNCSGYFHNDTKSPLGYVHPGFIVNNDRNLKSTKSPLRMVSHGTAGNYPDGVDFNNIILLDEGDEVGVMIYFRTSNITRLYAGHYQFSGVFIGGVNE